MWIILEYDSSAVDGENSPWVGHEDAGAYQVEIASASRQNSAIELPDVSIAYREVQPMDALINSRENDALATARTERRSLELPAS